MMYPSVDYEHKLIYWFNRFFSNYPASSVSFYAAPPSANKPPILFSTAPQPVSEYYIENECAKFDPRIKRARRSLVPFYWTPSGLELNDPQQKELMDVYQDFQMFSGICIPVHIGGRKVGGFSFNYSKTKLDPYGDIFPLYREAPLLSTLLLSYAYALGGSKFYEAEAIEAEMEHWHIMIRQYQKAIKDMAYDRVADTLLDFSQWLSNAEPDSIDSDIAFIQFAQQTKRLMQRLPFNHF